MGAGLELGGKGQGGEERMERGGGAREGGRGRGGPEGRRGEKEGAKG